MVWVKRRCSTGRLRSRRSNRFRFWGKALPDMTQTFGSVREKHDVDHSLALAGGHFCPLDHVAVFPNFVQ